MPVRRKIASNSASESACTPRFNSFSRGRSASGQSEIAIHPPWCVGFLDFRVRPSHALHADRIPAAARAVYLTRPFGNGVAVMIRLTNKHVLLGVTGGIAAYKSAELVRKLKDAAAQVR